MRPFIQSNEMSGLLDGADSAYRRYRRLVIDIADDGRPPTWNELTCAQRLAAQDLERAEQALADFRALRAGDLTATEVGPDGLRRSGIAAGTIQR